MTGKAPGNAVDRNRSLGTQSLVHTLGYCWRRPALTLTEVAWRWLFGAPALGLIYYESSRILSRVNLGSTGIGSTGISHSWSSDALGNLLKDPWKAAVVLSDTTALLMPAVQSVAVWLAPLLAIGWAIFSGVGRNLVMRRYDPSLQWEPASLIVLQLVRIVALACVFVGWHRCIQWAAQTTLGGGDEPNLVAYFAWVICISLGIFSLWSLVSWVLFIAPLLVMLEGLGALKALLRSTQLGREFTGKLVEVNLVLGIVKLMLIVLAMVFSATPLPFQTQLTDVFLHWWWLGVTLLYFVASDFFQVARLVSFVEFWKVSNTAPSALDTHSQR